jgi:O-antigen ligase
MNCNVGGIDRVVRLAVGLALVVLAATHTVGAWGWLGLIVLLTGIIRWCPAYALFGFKTCCKSRKP